MALKINALEDGSTELIVYGPISRDPTWNDDVITPNQFRKQLKALKGKSITVRINSPGGDMHSGNAIFNLLDQYSGDVTCLVDGIAASAASVIACAGTLKMAQNAMLMIHNAQTYASGDANEFKNIAKNLEKANQTMLVTYVAKTGLSEAEIKNMMDKETFLTAAEALELGFADEIIEVDKPISAYLDGEHLLLNGVQFSADANFINNLKKQNPHITFDAAKPANQTTTSNNVDNNSSQGENNMPILTMEAFQKENPTIYAQIFDAGKREGIKASTEQVIQQERARMKALDKLSEPGMEDLVAQAKDSGDAPGDLALKICERRNDPVFKAAQAQQQDATVLNGIDSLNLDPTNNKSNPEAKGEEQFFAGFQQFGANK